MAQKSIPLLRAGSWQILIFGRILLIVMWSSKELNGKSGNFYFPVLQFVVLHLHAWVGCVCTIYIYVNINAWILHFFMIVFHMQKWGLFFYWIYNNIINCLMADWSSLVWRLYAFDVHCNSFFPMFIMLYGNLCVTMYLALTSFNLTLCTTIIWRLFVLWQLYIISCLPYWLFMVSFLYCYRICFSWWRLLTIIISTF